MTRLALAACLCAVSLRAVADESVRIATFNVSLYGRRSGEILTRLNKGDDPQARAIAEIIQRVRPEVLLLNEIDYDAEGAVLGAFADKYLAVDQNVAGAPDGGSKAINYPHRFVAPSNTGRHSGFDLDHNGAVDAQIGNPNYGADCWGYGVYEGQYAFAVLSQHPIDKDAIRTFRTFLWKDMPGAQLPVDPAAATPTPWYPSDVLEKFPLSSKNHCDVPIIIRGRRIHFLASHPTPPVYDGPEDRNGRRNHDEIRFWADYISSSGSLPSAGTGATSTGDPKSPERSRYRSRRVGEGGKLTNRSTTPTFTTTTACTAVSPSTAPPSQPSSLQSPASSLPSSSSATSTATLTTATAAHRSPSFSMLPRS